MIAYLSKDIDGTITILLRHEFGGRVGDSVQRVTPGGTLGKATYAEIDLLGVGAVEVDRIKKLTRGA
jgi:hypothetical protein